MERQRLTASGPLGQDLLKIRFANPFDLQIGQECMVRETDFSEPSAHFVIEIDYATGFVTFCPKSE